MDKFEQVVQEKLKVLQCLLSILVNSSRILVYFPIYLVSKCNIIENVIKGKFYYIYITLSLNILQVSSMEEDFNFLLFFFSYWTV